MICCDHHFFGIMPHFFTKYFPSFNMHDSIHRSGLIPINPIMVIESGDMHGSRILEIDPADQEQILDLPPMWERI